MQEISIKLIEARRHLKDIEERLARFEPDTLFPVLPSIHSDSRGAIFSYCNGQRKYIRQSERERFRLKYQATEEYISLKNTQYELQMWIRNTERTLWKINAENYPRCYVY